MLVRNVDIIRGNTRAGNILKISVPALKKTKPYKKEKKITRRGRQKGNSERLGREKLAIHPC